MTTRQSMLAMKVAFLEFFKPIYTLITRKKKD